MWVVADYVCYELGGCSQKTINLQNLCTHTYTLATVANEQPDDFIRPGGSAGFTFSPDSGYSVMYSTVM